MKKGFLIIFFILILSAVLRFWQFGKIPEGFHADEAAFGYNAYSILLTGRDEYGNFLPLTLRSFDDYKGAIYAYIAVPFVRIFGLSEIAVRVPSAVFGILFVLLVYKITIIITKDKKLSLLTSLLFSISPLSILLSRVQSDPLVAIFFVVLGFYFFLKWIEKGKIVYLFSNYFFWLLSFFIYASPRIFIPFFIILLLIFYFRNFPQKKKIIFMIFALILMVIDCMLIFNTSGARFDQLSIINNPRIILPLEEKIREDAETPIIVTRLFHNKITDHAIYLISNYFQYLNFDFLFLHGGEPLREKIPNTGILYLIEFPFLIYGFFLILMRKIKWGYFAMLWILIVPGILSLAVDESPNVHRFYLAIFPLELIVGFGILGFLDLFKNNKVIKSTLLFLLFLFFLLNIIYFLHQLFVHQPLHRPWYRGYAYKELTEILKTYEAKYKKIYITKAHATPYVYFLFFNQIDPKYYQSLGSPRDYDYKGFGKYYFVPSDCPFSGINKEDLVTKETGVLYVERGDCITPAHNARLLKTIQWKDNSPAFKVLEYVSTESANIKY